MSRITDVSGLTKSLPQSFSTPVNAGRIAHPGKFPRIEGLEDLASLRGKPGIGFFAHGEIIIVRYTSLLPETFETSLDLEARGLIFDRRSGALLSRPLHKFFNLGERQGLSDLDFRGGARLDMKLDGTMVPAFGVAQGIVLHTKGGLSAQGAIATRSASPDSLRLAAEAIEAGTTPIFEWTAPENRVIIPYAQPELTLLALRHRHSGRYDDALAADLASRHGVPRAPSLATHLAGPADLLAAYAELRDRADIEGAVLVFPDGHRLKLKTAPYLRRHKILANLANEKYAYMAWVEDVVDDTSAALGGERAQALIAFCEAIESRIDALDIQIRQKIQDLSLSDRSQAAAAIRARLPVPLHPLAFAMLSGHPLREHLRATMKKRVGQPEKRAAMKADFGLPDWVPDILSYS